MLRGLIIFVIYLAVAMPASGEENARKAVQVITPEGVCVGVSRTEGDLVYLVTRKGRCKSTMIPVMVDKDVYQLKVYVDDKPWQEQGLVAVAVPDMETMQAETRKITDNIKLPDPENNKDAIEAGRKIGEHMNSDVYQARVLAEAERIRSEVLHEGDVLKKFYPDEKIAGKKTVGTLGGGERVYVFISSSMPMETLRNYAISIDKGNDPNVVMVMRGLIGGISKLIPTMEFIGRFLIKDSACLARSVQSGGALECDTYGAEVLIDPMLFSRYDIGVVPAVVYATGVKPYDPEGSEGFEGNTQVGASKTVFGDAALDAVIETIADNTKSKSLEVLVKKMRAGYYN